MDAAQGLGVWRKERERKQDGGVRSWERRSPHRRPQGQPLSPGSIRSPGPCLSAGLTQPGASEAAPVGGRPAGFCPRTAAWARALQVLVSLLEPGILTAAGTGHVADSLGPRV